MIASGAKLYGRQPRALAERGAIAPDDRGRECNRVQRECGSEDEREGLCVAYRARHAPSRLAESVSCLMTLAYSGSTSPIGPSAITVPRRSQRARRQNSCTIPVSWVTIN